MRLGIIGAGNVGASFLLALRTAVEITGLTGSSPEQTRTKARELQVTPCEAAELLARSDVILLSVQDDAIASAAAALAREAAKQPMPYTEKYLFHCSGAMGLDALQPLAELGLHTGSLHPLQSFPHPSAEALQNIFFAVDGDEAAGRTAAALAGLTGSRTFRVPPEERALYHAAACFCSNYVVTAVAIAQEMMSRWTATPDDAGTALRPLLDGTIRNLHAAPLARTALTGPIARGDGGTLQKHLSVLPPDLKEPYCAFGLAAAALAQQNHTITQSQYDRLVRILSGSKGASL